MSKNYLIDFTDEEKKIIRSQFFPPSATSQDMQYCMSVAKELGLNPILKEIHFVERKAKINGQWVTKIEPMPGRNAWYKLAHNSGKFAGIESEAHIEDVPVFENGVWTVKPDLVATATVYRKDTDHPFKVKVAFHEYAQKTKDGDLTQFWKTKPETMLIKVAEVQALKKAFMVSGVYDESEIGDEIVAVGGESANTGGERAQVHQIEKQPDPFAGTMNAEIEEVSIDEIPA